MIDLEGHFQVVDEAAQYLTYLIYQLGNSYDGLSTQSIEIENLANAIDALIFSNEKLKEQRIKLESYKKSLQNINSKSDDEAIREHQIKKEQQAKLESSRKTSVNSK
jgi:hypothetical protein